MLLDAPNSTDLKKYLFGNIFLLANRIQVIGDQTLGNGGMTIKQWFLTIMVLKFGNYSPTLGEVAELMGSSHQNVKQLALKLQQKGFLMIEKDEQDARTLRLSLTNGCYLLWKKQDLEIKEVLNELLRDLNKNETDVLYDFLIKLQARVLLLERNY